MTLKQPRRFTGGRWLYVAFMCHQAIEKTLKAYWCGTQPEDPPYTHSHLRLANGCGLYNLMDEQQRDFLDTITNYNIEARYPEDKRGAFAHAEQAGLPTTDR